MKKNNYVSNEATEIGPYMPLLNIKNTPLLSKRPISSCKFVINLNI
jgi:hypothetical protein